MKNSFNEYKGEYKEIVQRRNGRSYKVRLHRNRVFFPKEWISFYDCLKENQKMTFDFLLNTGARINEAVNVTCNDIDFIKKVIHLRVVKKKCIQSTGYPRFIPMSTSFSIRLLEYIKSKGVSGDIKLGLLTASSAHSALKWGLIRAGIKDWYMFSLHNIRKTLETWLVSQNLGTLKVMKHMGHNVPTALKHYIQPDLFTPEDKIMIKDILGDLYKGDGLVDALYVRIEKLEEEIKVMHKRIEN